MASHQLAIAKASFSAGLLRPDPTSLSRDDIAHFHTLLNSVVVQCTSLNVQKCKHWILENTVQSTARSTALGKYLTALANSFAESTPTPIKREPSIKRKRLHLLYLINDLLYHAKYRANDASVCSKVQPILVNLFGSASSFKDCPKHQQKISDILEIWEENGYYAKDYIGKLREAVKNSSEAGGFAPGDAGTSGEGQQASTTKLTKSTPYVLPAMHGDSSTPWFDLPAGNLMPAIVPNSTRPINPEMIKPMQFVAGPASEDLVDAVKALLDDVQTIYGQESKQDEGIPGDIDELGQLIIVDEITGDVLEAEGYYGWSRGFCEKMKRRKKGLDRPGRGEGHDRRSRSRSSSRGRKRARSDSESSLEGYRSRRRRHSSSSSRSPESDRERNGRHRPRSRDRSYSRSPRRSPSPHRMNPYPREGHPSSGPDNGFPPPPPPLVAGNPVPPPPPNMPFPGFNPNFPPPPPPPFNSSGPPPFGSWPPPPPPINFNQQGPWPIPPPPPGNPPPMNYQAPGGFSPNGPGGWQGGDGRGYSHNTWNSGHRGGRGGNYRGRGWS